MTTSSDTHSNQTILHGWQRSGTDRGSIDIIWACVVTIVLCCWVSTHPNVPGVNDKRHHRFVDKFNLACIGLLGPDFLVVFAMGQFANARRSVKLFAEHPGLGKGREWTLAHGFFADMGGFHLTSPDYPEGFPVTSEQVFYLVKHGHIEYPSLTKEDIKDMSHVDTLSKVIVVWQVTWFIITELVRVSKGLPMTTLELTALSFSFMMVVTSLVWYHKPTITRPVVISTKADTTVEDIRTMARSTTYPGLPQQWFRSPLYFISGPRLFSDVIWAYYKELSFLAHCPIFGRQIKTNLWDRIPDDLWLPISDPWMWFFGGVHFSVSFFGGIFILSNEIRYLQGSRRPPKAVDAEHGRDNFFANCDGVELLPKANTVDRMSGRLQTLLDRASRRLDSWTNLSPTGDPEMRLRWWRTLVPMWVVTLFYPSARLYIFIEDFISMRSQPQGIYVTVSRFFML
ncbi:hypothetical protein GE09DRAFT_1241929 [Coniochaeta sp. 2T2.1]|nr:hypothetical protein GE09DRAFT_1241929 [Coniochaeta sp. 2T2.1]